MTADIPTPEMDVLAEVLRRAFWNPDNGGQWPRIAAEVAVALAAPHSQDAPETGDIDWKARALAYEQQVDHYRDLAESTRERLAAVTRVLNGHYPMPYCGADGRIVVDLLRRIREASLPPGPGSQGGAS